MTAHTILLDENLNESRKPLFIICGWFASVDLLQALNLISTRLKLYRDSHSFILI